MNKTLYYKQDEFSFLNFLKLIIQYKNNFLLVLILSLFISILINIFYLKKYNFYNIDINLKENSLKESYISNQSLFDKFNSKNICILFEGCKNNDFEEIYIFQISNIPSLFLDKQFHLIIYNKLSFKKNFKSFRDYFSRLQKLSFLSNIQKKFRVVLHHNSNIDEYLQIYSSNLEKTIDQLTIEKYSKNIKDYKTNFINNFINLHQNQCKNYSFLNCKFSSELLSNKEDSMFLNQQFIKIKNNLLNENILIYSNSIYEEKNKNILYYRLKKTIIEVLDLNKISNNEILYFLNILLKNNNTIYLQNDIEKLNFKYLNLLQIFLILFTILSSILTIMILILNFIKHQNFSIK